MFYVVFFLLTLMLPNFSPNMVEASLITVFRTVWFSKKKMQSNLPYQYLFQLM